MTTTGSGLGSVEVVRDWQRLIPDLNWSYLTMVHITWPQPNPMNAPKRSASLSAVTNNSELWASAGGHCPLCATSGHSLDNGDVTSGQACLRGIIFTFRPSPA